AKTDNGEVQLQALVDWKKIIITELIVRRDLQLEDVKGVDCLPNATIFEQLTLMGSKTTAWNEFSSTMASTIICLATNQKFNFSKYIFESMVKNLENVYGKFLMYPSGPTDNVADEAVYEEMDDSLERAATTATSLDAVQDRGNINKTQSKATPNEPSSLGTSSGGGPRCQETIGDTIAQTGFENVSKHSNDPLLARGSTLRSGKVSLKLQELMELCITLQLRVLALETTKTTQAMEITSLKRRVKKLEKRNKSRSHRLKRLYKVGSSRRVEYYNEEGLGKEDASKQGRIDDINDDAGITLDSTHFNVDTDMFGVHDLDGNEVIVDNEDVVTTAEETRSMVKEVTAVTIPVKLKSAKPKANKVVIQEPEQGTTTPTLTTTTTELKSLLFMNRSKLAREKAQLVEEANIAWDDVQAKIEAAYQLAQRLQAQEQKELTDEEKARLVNTFVDYKTKLVEESSKKAEVEIAHESILKRAGEELEQESSKKQKLEEDKESKELKQCLEIIPDDGDDVTINATPLSTKSPTIVDYKISKKGKKSYFQIIRADEPANYMDSFLLLNLKTMFEHHIEDNIWKNQQGLVKVMNWKLYDSCGVHYLSMKKLEILKKNIKFRGGLLGLKNFMMILKLLLLRSNLRNITVYAAYSDPQGVIYKDQNNRDRFMRSDELNKFSDGTLNDVQTALHDITSGIRMEYLPKREWSGLDKRRAHVMIHNIDKLLFERRLMSNLVKLVGGREYRNDLKLLE
ncbi:hypothetical protein Tco_1226556, partial [Tanacetum coccineum]